MKIFAIITATILTIFGLNSAPVKDFQGRNEKSVLDMYSERDLSNCSLYAGGWSNFGYWEKGHSTPMSYKERESSEENMYRYILDHLFLTDEDRILELGSGRGLGASLIEQEYSYANYLGLDICTNQVKNAKKEHQDLLKKTKKINFKVGQAEKMPLDNESFQKIFSVDAAQHFYPFENFAQESYRVLKQDGKVVISSTFATSDGAVEKAKQNLQTVKEGINRMISIDEAKKHLQNQGFKDVHIEPIGSYVFSGFDQWISQQEDFKDSWRRAWYTSYQDALIDYYVISATKPVEVTIG